MKNLHVVPCGEKWAVRSEGSQRALRIAHTRAEALEVARRIARNRGSDVVIHERDGTIEKDSYGNDPFPLHEIERKVG